MGWSTSLGAPCGGRDGLGSGGRCHPVDHTGDKSGWRRPEPLLPRNAPGEFCARVPSVGMERALAIRASGLPSAPIVERGLDPNRAGR